MPHYHKLLIPPHPKRQEPVQYPICHWGRGEEEEGVEAVWGCPMLCFPFFSLFFFPQGWTFSARNMRQGEGRVWRERIMSQLTFQFDQFRKNHRIAKSISLKDNHHNVPVTDLLVKTMCARARVCVQRSLQLYFSSVHFNPHLMYS